MVKKGVMRFGKVEERQDSKLKSGTGNFNRLCLLCDFHFAPSTPSTEITTTTATTTNMGSNIERLGGHASHHNPVKDNHIQVMSLSLTLHHVAREMLLHPGQVLQSACHMVVDNLLVPRIT